MNFLSFFLRSRSHSVGDSLKPLPWVEEKIVRLEWEQTSNHYNLKTTSSSDESVEFEIDASAFGQVTSSKLSSDISHLTYKTYENFKKALDANDQHKKFNEWWKAIAYSNGRLIQFNFDQGPWDIPWEMLLGVLRTKKARTETTIVRCIGQPEETCRAYWTEAIRILIIQADSGDLDLDKNVESILSTWNGLESELKRAVHEPKVIKADKKSIIKQLSEFKPHMVWFLGHGFFDEGVHLVFSEADTITAKEFSELFDLAKHCPEFAVFWACETSKGTSTLRSERPDLFTALSNKGVGTMIGMQSAISDDAAIVMSSQLFRGIAQGLPLEWAIAQARTFLYPINDKEKEKATMDWAAPVVWTARRPVAHLKWSQSELDHLQLQLLGTISIQKSQPPEAGLEVEPPDDDACSRANDWLPFSITIVRGDKNSPEHKLWFLRTLKGVQTVSEKAVLVIEPEDGKIYEQNLRRWAQGFLEGLEKGRIPEELSARIDILTNDAKTGWRQLCSLENVFLAVIGPPPASEDWFWTPLFKLSNGIAILTKSEIPDRFKELQVNYVTAGDTAEITRIESATQKHYRLFVALSLLNLPVRAETLKEQDFGREAGKVFESWSDLFVKTFGGCVIRADVREWVLSTADAESYTQARRDCLQLTEMMGHAQKPYLKEFRIDLLREIGNDDMAVQELSDLLHLYRERNEQVPMLRAVEKHFKLRGGLLSWEWLDIAGVYLRFGQQRSARYWLTQEQTNALDIPLWLSLRAEYTKNEGDINHARELVEQAITRSRENQANEQLSQPDRQQAEWDCLKYRHERARLLHFQAREYSEAAREYLEIIYITENSIPQTGSHPLLNLRAITHRNLGECLLDLKDDNPEDRWRDAEFHFQTALEQEGIDSFSNLISEVRYQLAKLAVDRSDPAEVRKQLELCIASAEESRHGQISIIARNRLLWLDVQEKGLHWNDIAQQWDFVAEGLRGRLEHSWEARTLINSNVNAAAMLIKENRYALGQQHLQENLAHIRHNKYLCRGGGGDLGRVAKTLAGLQLIANAPKGDMQNYWALLETEFADAGMYARKMGWHIPEQAWEGGLYYGYK